MRLASALLLTAALAVPTVARAQPADTVYSTPTGGLWSEASTWTGGIVPDADATFVVRCGATVTVRTVSAGSLTVRAGGRIVNAQSAQGRVSVRRHTRNDGRIDAGNGGSLVLELDGSVASGPAAVWDPARLELVNPTFSSDERTVVLTGVAEQAEVVFSGQNLFLTGENVLPNTVRAFTSSRIELFSSGTLALVGTRGTPLTVAPNSSRTGAFLGTAPITPFFNNGEVDVAVATPGADVYNFYAFQAERADASPITALRVRTTRGGAAPGLSDNVFSEWRVTPTPALGAGPLASVTLHYNAAQLGSRDPGTLGVYVRVGAGAFVPVVATITRGTNFVRATGALPSDATYALSTSPVAAEAPTAADGLALAFPRPNPARGHVEVPFALAAPGPARLVVVDALGRVAARLHDGPLGAGPHAATVDAGGLALGVYTVRLETAAGVRTRRLVVVR